MTASKLFPHRNFFMVIVASSSSYYYSFLFILTFYNRLFVSLLLSKAILSRNIFKYFGRPFTGGVQF